ncbi:MAG: methylenetetrahydrofolate reductase C-terminal domain-containing protein [Candidatus Omnitrophota bacterium]|nr:methylenetetrahydrofolate reductase C-terminal domain-containing protein [Candidatus Omnitrophota bacterium]
MIVTQRKPLEEILSILKDQNKVFLVGCGECSTTCHTGGEKEVLEMKQFLEAQGKKVTGWVIPNAPCIAAQTKTAFAQNMPALKDTQAILVMSCGLGVQSVKENDRLKLEVFPALNSMFGTLMDSKGSFYEVCSNCGDCVLDKTGCICPITRCSKGLLNGPCGGVIKGKCEVDRDRDCAWVLIYKELERKGQLDKMKALSAPKDYSKTTKPHKVLVS